jgi:hypothetical protein
MSGRIGVLEEHQGRLAERRAELRGRVCAATQGFAASEAQVKEWLKEIEELSERIGMFHARISEIHAAADLDRQAEALRSGQEFALRDRYESAELAVPA